MSTAIPQRVDESGQPYTVDVEDTSHALLKLAGGAVGVITNSWATRVRRDDTMVVQIDGTGGSAVAGRMRCFTQSAVNTPEAFFGGGRPANVDFFAQWQEVPDTLPVKNPFRHCWEAFLHHVGEDAPYVPQRDGYLNADHTRRLLSPLALRFSSIFCAVLYSMSGVHELFMASVGTAFKERAHRLAPFIERHDDLGQPVFAFVRIGDGVPYQGEGAGVVFETFLGALERLFNRKPCAFIRASSKSRNQQHG